MEIIFRIEKILQEFFDDDTIMITEDTKASDVEGWDSLANVQIMLSIEDEFCVHFELEDFEKFKNIGDIVRRIKSIRGE